MPTKIKLPPAKSFEEIWAIIQESNELRKETEKLMKENAEQLKESREWRKETEKLMKENAEQLTKNGDWRTENEKMIKESAEWRKEIEKMMKETDKRMKETDRLIKENGRQLGDVHNRVGELVEHIILPNILKKVEPLNFKFKHVRKRFKFTDKNYRVIAEADILLINGEDIMIIEVKTVLKVKDVDDHLKRLERIKREAFPPDESRRFIGCVAGAVADETVKNYAHKKGLYVLEQSGDTLKLDVPEGFTPRMW
ncbi:MAG: hypothetical protein LBJ86_02995 [Spirochaetaceae bacterium]|jgi:hypothetical protein|nr:hypothetical protein [Spirochaetaceae bacterium]